MLRPRHLALMSMLAVAVPVASVSLDAREQWSQPQIWTRPAQTPAYNTGYTYGVTAGEEDGRRGQSFNFADESNYRRGDVGYRSQYGDRDRYRDDFRRGFESGYRVGYNRNARSGGYGNGNYGGYGNPGTYGGYGNYGSYNGRTNLALNNGYTDGYNEGLKDGRDRHRNDPIAESRYRGGDHGYESWYGPKQAYQNRYRDAFRSGYEQGYRDARPW